MTDLRNDERGFTLVEVLVATMLMVMVLMALYALFDMSLRVYGIGNSEVETNERARIALERMEREIRNAVCVDGSNCVKENDGSVGGGLTIETQLSDDSTAHVTYKVVDKNLVRETCTPLIPAADAICETLSVPAASIPGSILIDRQPLAELGESGTLSFNYCDETYKCGDDVQPESAAMIEIDLVVTDGSNDRKRTQTLNTVAGLRNAS